MIYISLLTIKICTEIKPNIKYYIIYATNGNFLIEKKNSMEILVIFFFEFKLIWQFKSTQKSIKFSSFLYLTCIRRLALKFN